MYLHRMKISIMLYQLVSIHIHVTSILLTNYTVMFLASLGVVVVVIITILLVVVFLCTCARREICCWKKKRVSRYVAIRDKGIKGSLFGLQGLGGGVGGS